MTERETAISILLQCPRPVVLELGAHCGADTEPLYDACLGRDTTYIAVEPDPRAFAQLMAGVGARKVVLIQAAIAAHVGTVALHLCGGDSVASSSIRAPKEHLACFPWIAFEQDIEVAALTLDELTARRGIGDVDLIWCDIQGAERDMIAGGARTLARTRHLILECDRIEMYEGQLLRSQILDALPDFELIEEWPDNANLYLRRRA